MLMFVRGSDEAGAGRRDRAWKLESAAGWVKGASPFPLLLLASSGSPSRTFYCQNPPGSRLQKEKLWLAESQRQRHRAEYREVNTELSDTSPVTSVAVRAR